MKQIFQLGTLSALNLGLVSLFQWYVLTQLGAGIETDALFAGMTIPQLVVTVISGSLMHVLVPIFAGESEERLRHDAWGLIILVSGLFGLLAVLLYVSAPWWIPFTVPGFNEIGQALAIDLTRIQLLGMVFSAINGVQWAAYHARQQFLWAEFAPILSSILSLLLLTWLLPKYGAVAAAWISTLRITLQTFFLAPGMGKPVRPNWKSVAIQQAWQRIKPLLLGTAYYKTDPLVDRFLLSTANSGSLSLYYFAQQIYSAINQVINKAIAAPLVPLLSKLHKSSNKEDFRRAYRRKLLQVGVLGVAALLVLSLFGRFILYLLIGHGNISAGNVDELWWIIIWLGGVFIGGSLGQVSSSSFYALGDTTIPTRIGIYSYTFYIPAKLVLFYYYGVMGLALSTSLFVVMNFFLQDWQLQKKYF